MTETKDELRQNIEDALDEIRPFLESDGGNVILVDVKGDCATVKFEGACVGCSVNRMTLKSGIEMVVKKNVPQITRVEEVS